jgi:transposase
MARIPQQDPIHLGLDVHRDTISVATLLPDAAAAAVEQIPSDEAAVLALVGRFAEPGRLRVCYEAGPTGYELARLLHRQGVACQVIAPSLIPRAAGDKVKTDRRDCRRLARLHRAGELVAIRIPSAREEAVRDLCRARADLVDDRSRARRQLQSLLLRHGRGLSRRCLLDRQARALAGRPALRRPAAASHLRPLPGSGGHPRRGSVRHRGRPGCGRHKATVR